MKKRIFVVLLLAVLLVSALASPAFADEVCFIAINDNLLELTSMPAFVGSTAYVPSWVFGNFHLYYSFFSSDNVAMVYTEAKQFYFELSSGNTYDSSGRYYSTQAILRNGQVYLPAAFICGQFGLTYSYIPGTGHGDIVRITDGSAVIPDDRFASAASILMDIYYNTYMGVAPSPPPGQRPSVPDVTPDDEPDRRDTEILLSFIGLPSDKLLNTLDAYSAPACFFLTADEIRSAPDTVRRIVGGAYGVGVLCGEQADAEYTAAAELLFDAARIHPLLIAAAPEADAELCRTTAADRGLFFLDYDIDAIQDGSGASSAAAVTSLIEFTTDHASVRFTSGGTTEHILSDVLRYLTQNHFSIRVPRETDAVQ